MSQSSFRSPFAALVWKEWREQRLVWGALLVLIMAMELMIPAPAMGSLAPTVIFFWCALAALLGANAFAGESAATIELFMEQTPVSRSRRFWVKMGVAAVLLWSCQAATSMLLPHGALAPPRGRLMFEAASSGYGFFFVWGAVFYVIVAACAAAGCPGSMLTAAAGAGGTLMVLCAVLFYGRLHSLIVDERFRVEQYVWWIPVLSLALMAALGLACAWALWAVRDVGALKALLRRSVRIVAVSAAVLLVLTAGLYLWFAFFGRLTPAYPAVSPDGRYVAFNCGAGDQPSWTSRVLILDTQTGKTHWLTHFYSSVGRNWSPDDRRFVVTIDDAWPRPCWPILWRLLPNLADHNEGYIYDVATGEFTPIPELDVNFNNGREQRQITGWIDDNTVAISPPEPVGGYIGPGYAERYWFDFKDIATGRCRRCDSPAGVHFSIWAESLTGGSGGLWVQAWNSAQPQGILCNFRPEWAIAHEVKLETVEGKSIELLHVSPDNRWVFGCVCDRIIGDARQSACSMAPTIWSLETGHQQPMGAPPIVMEVPQPLTWMLNGGFTPDSKELLLADANGFGIYHLGEQRYQTLCARPKGAPPAHYQVKLSRAGDRVLVQETSQGKLYMWTLDLTTGRRHTIWRTGDSKIEADRAEWLGDDRVMLFSGKYPQVERWWILDVNGRVVREKAY